MRWSPGFCGLLRFPTFPSGLSMSACGVARSVNHHLVGSASCSPACPAPQSATSLGPPATALLQVLSAPAAHLRPSYWSGRMFLIYLLGCQTSIEFDFLSVLVVFVFKLFLSVFWSCEEAQCVYLRLHLGRKPCHVIFMLGFTHLGI